MANRRNTAEKIANQFDYILTAYHEVGHAIYALLHLMQVKCVLIFENKEFERIDGLTYYNYLSQLDSVIEAGFSRVPIRYEIGMNYAGLIAEKILLQSITGSAKTPMFVSEGSCDDNKNARALIQKYGIAEAGKQRGKYKQKLMKEIRDEIDEYWDDIVLVSHALFSSHKLRFDELRKLLERRSDNKIFWKEQFRKIDRLYSSTIDTESLRIILGV
jgi:ATP-dependent Zn protease